MSDLIKMLKDAGFEPEVIEDVNFGIIRGGYICRIDSAGRVSGNSKKSGEPYDFRTIKLQVAEIVEGDRATNRFLDISYNLDENGTKRLLNDLHTAGIECKVASEDELDTFLGTLKDKTMNIRAYPTKKMKKEGEEWVPVEPTTMKQKLKVVKEIKGTKKPSEIKSDVPF